MVGKLVLKKMGNLTMTNENVVNLQLLPIALLVKGCWQLIWTLVGGTRYHVGGRYKIPKKREGFTSGSK